MPSLPNPSIKKAKILVILHDQELGEASEVALGIMNCLEPWVEYRIVYASKGPLNNLTQSMAPSYYLSNSERGSELQSNPQVGGPQTSATQWVADFDPDLLYVHTALALKALNCLTLSNKPLLLHLYRPPAALANGYAHQDIFESWTGLKDILCLPPAFSMDAGTPGITRPRAMIPSVWESMTRLLPSEEFSINSRGATRR